jgi:hypothetical protein
MRSARNPAKSRHGRRTGGQPEARGRAHHSNVFAFLRRLPAARISFQKFEVLFWLVFLLLPAFTGWLDYQPLPNEHYDPQQHQLLSFHVREGWPNGLGSYKVPETWRDEKSGEQYSAQLFVEHHKREARRLGITCFAYGLFGCAFFGYSRVVRKKNTFLKAFRSALMVDFIVSMLAFVIA